MKKVLYFGLQDFRDQENQLLRNILKKVEKNMEIQYY